MLADQPRRTCRVQQRPQQQAMGRDKLLQLVLVDGSNLPVEQESRIQGRAVQGCCCSSYQRRVDHATKQREPVFSSVAL